MIHAIIGAQRWYDLIHFTVTGHYHFIVRVTQCKEAYLVLSEIPGITLYNSYEIQLGINGNTESRILHNRGGTELVRESTSQILDCNEQRTFWITWPGDHSSQLEVGKGEDPGIDIVMKASIEDSFLLNSVSVSSGNEESGLWEFRDLGLNPSY